MIWLSWRQFRGQAVTGAAIVAVLAIVLAATGLHLASLYASAGLDTCHASCGQLAANFISSLKNGAYGAIFYLGIAVLYLAPALIGIFWGAPLVSREIESGTLRLAWSQSVTRGRWIVVKLAVAGLAAVITAGLLSLIITWWASPVDRALNLGSRHSPVSFNRLSPLIFDARGVAPLGYAAFAFALGVAAGVLIRRTLPAMAVTLVVFAAIQLLVPMFIRPNIIPPEHVTAPLNVSSASVLIRQGQGTSAGLMTVQGDFSRPGAWFLSNQTVRPDGQVFTGPATSACLGNSQAACSNWLAAQHLHQSVSYQPASRFWPLQWLELGIYLILASALGAVCAVLIRRRRS